MMQLLFIIYQFTVAAVFIVFFVRMWLTRKRQEMTNLCMVIHYQDAEILLETSMLKKFSLATAYIVISLAGLSSAGAQAALDGVLSVESSDRAYSR